MENDAFIELQESVDKIVSMILDEIEELERFKNDVLQREG